MPFDRLFAPFWHFLSTFSRDSWFVTRESKKGAEGQRHRETKGEGKSKKAKPERKIKKLQRSKGHKTQEHKSTRTQDPRQKIADRAIFISFFPALCRENLLVFAEFRRKIHKPTVCESIVISR